ncbi:hypothetical protein KUCAC02_025305, partial [Chaenocephalus aceratus]
RSLFRPLLLLFSVISVEQLALSVTSDSLGLFPISPWPPSLQTPCSQCVAGLILCAWRCGVRDSPWTVGWGKNCNLTSFGSNYKHRKSTCHTYGYVLLPCKGCREGAKKGEGYMHGAIGDQTEAERVEVSKGWGRDCEDVGQGISGVSVVQEAVEIRALISQHGYKGEDSAYAGESTLPGRPLSTAIPEIQSYKVGVHLLLPAEPK